MTESILVQLPLLFAPDAPEAPHAKPMKTCLARAALNFHAAWLHPKHLPAYITQSPTVMRILDLIGPLDWEHFPERDLKPTLGHAPVPYAALIAAELIKLNEGLSGLKQLRLFLSEHPGFISLLNFSPQHALHLGFSFNTPPPASCLPTQRHLARMLREIPNSVLQFLLADSARLIIHELQQRHLPGSDVGDCISLDTKHILAWVKENNPKAYVADRYNKDKQPPGDPDCKLGCKRRHNKQVARRLFPNARRQTAQPSLHSSRRISLGLWLRRCRHQSPGR